MVGAAKITLPNTLVCIWGDDQLTESKEGLYTSESYSFKVWQASTNTLKAIEVLHENENIYTQDNLIIAESVIDSEVIETVQLFDAVPNPSSKQTLIRLYLNELSEIQLNLFDILGNKVHEISSGEFEKGYHEFKIDLSRLSAGTYLYQISSNDKRKSKRLEIIK